MKKWKDAIAPICAVVVCSPLLYLWGMLAWIKYWPIPPVPQSRIEYSITDIGTLNEPYPSGLYGRNPLIVYPQRLEADRTLREIAKSETENDKLKRDELNAAFAHRFGLKQTPRHEEIVSVAGEIALVLKDRDYWFLQGGKLIVKKPKGVEGYSWEFYDTQFHKLNGRNQAVGNSRLSTGYASSGGTSEPHGRQVPLLWNCNNKPARDLNTLIDAKSNWYLDQTIDISDTGQILCIARQTDAKGAESYSNTDYHFIALTPLK